MAVWRGSSTCRPRGIRHRSSIGASGPGSRWWASGTLGEGKPLGSCAADSRHCTYEDALEVASTTSLVWNKSASKALAAHGDGTLAPGYCSGAGRSDHAGGCLASGPGCSRRMVIVPLPGDGRMKSPWRMVFVDCGLWGYLVDISHIIRY